MRIGPFCWHRWGEWQYGEPRRYSDTKRIYIEAARRCACCNAVQFKVMD